MQDKAAQSMTQTGTHEDVKFCIQIDKTRAGGYGATVRVELPTHTEMLYWDDGSFFNLESGGVARLRKGQTFRFNPYNQVLAMTQGHIDARLDQLAALRAAEQYRDDPEPINAMAALIGWPAVNDQIKTIQQSIEESNMAISPRTNPTDEQLEAMAESLSRLVSRFSVPGLSALTGIGQQAIREWVKRGRISAQAANDICKLPEISGAGFTRETLRPDVPYWYAD